MAAKAKSTRGQLIQRGPNTWLLKVYLGEFPDLDDPGKRKKKYASKTFKGAKREAEAALSAYVVENDRGEVTQKARMVLAEYLRDWLYDTVWPAVGTEGGIRLRTFLDYQDVLERYIFPPEWREHRKRKEAEAAGKEYRPHARGKARVKRPNALVILAACPLDKLTFREIEDAYKAMRLAKGDNGEGGLGLHVKTVRHLRVLLKPALHEAMREGIIRSNPAADAYTPRKGQRKRHKATTVKPKRVALSDADTLRFLEAAQRDKFAALWLVQVTGGLRPSETLALRWSDLDLSRETRGIAHVNRVWSARSRLMEDTKTDAGERSVVLPKATVEALNRHEEQQNLQRLAAGPKWQDQGLVFASSIGTPMNHSNLYNRHFKKVAQAAGLPAGADIYALRHTYTTIRVGRFRHGIEQVSKTQGHAGKKITEEVYLHPHMGVELEQVSDWDQFLEGVAGAQ